MLEIEIQGYNNYQLEHAVFDYNGTLAKDGFINEKIKKQLQELNNVLKVHILTADTFGRVTQELGKFPFNIHILTAGNEQEQKKEFVENLNPKSVIAFGNGNNDILMLKICALGIGVIGKEGMSSNVLSNADIIVNDIENGIDLLFNPKRIKATLRK